MKITLALILLSGCFLCHPVAQDKTVRARTVATDKKLTEADANATVATPQATPTPPDYSESRPAPTPASARCENAPTDAQTILRQARSLFIRSKAPYVRAHEIEEALLTRRDWAALRITITRNEGEADLVLELGHKYLTTRFFFTVVDGCAQSVAAGGSVSSLFGTVHGKVSDSFVKQVRRAREN